MQTLASLPIVQRGYKDLLGNLFEQLGGSGGADEDLKEPPRPFYS